MNNSQRTVALARGIYLWALRQDQPQHGRLATRYAELFQRWAARYPELEQAAKAEQYKLFDLALNLRG